VIKTSLFSLLVAALCSSVAFAEDAPKPLTEGELLKQIESLTPGKAPTPGASTASTAKPATDPLFNNTPGAGGDIIKPPGGSGKPGEKKAKGPTEITALEALFDQKANVAIFIGSVVVKDPEFNVVCDKLTAHLKHEDKNGAPAGTPAGKNTPTPATPKADTGAAAPKKKSGGLEKAEAITTSERRVIITQDKTEADGSITHSIGKSDKATYDAVTGDIVLTGNPDVTQGINRCVATDPSTIMTLNRDGHMRAQGPHKTIITDSSDRDSK